MSEMHVVICSSTSNTGDIIPGSKRTIAYCGHEVWVAPTTQLTMAKFTAVEMILVCGKCAETLMNAQTAAGIPIEIKPLTPEQEAEVAEVLWKRRDA